MDDQATLDAGAQGADVAEPRQRPHDVLVVRGTVEVVKVVLLAAHAAQLRETVTVRARGV